MSHIPFQTIDWSSLPATEHPGEQSTSFWHTLQYEGLRIRIVDYQAGYMADHWCSKGHIVHCLEGAFTSELKTGAQFTLTRGMSYVVSDDLSEHRSFTDEGARLLIIDGDFLKLS